MTYNASHSMYNEIIENGLSNALSNRVRFVKADRVALANKMKVQKHKEDYGHFIHSRFHCSVIDSANLVSKFQWDAIWTPKSANEYTQRKFFIELEVSGLNIHNKHLEACSKSLNKDIIDIMANHFLDMQEEMFNEMKANGEKESTRFTKTSLDSLMQPKN